jgi:Putative  PD-(D/E)XK family member, (DUF4420)
VPLRLAGIEAQFSVPCVISESGESQRTETLSVIVCLSRERGVDDVFASVTEALIALMSPEPSVAEFASAVDKIVDLFQKLRTPAQRPLIGLVGELCLVLSARDSAAAVRAWRTDPEERFDFVVGNLRLDAKASSGGRTTHGVSFEQANPPPGTHGMFATLSINPAGGGTSIGELISAIEVKLAKDHRAIARMWSVVAGTVGESLPSALGWRFDLNAAESSLRLYDGTHIPAIRPPVPQGVSGIRFMSDFGPLAEVDLVWLSRLTSMEAAILPVRQ